MKLAKKENYRMFGKNIYLIGVTTNNEKVFLEEPSWNCGWYWGFGYLDTYTNNRCITKSKDISSHSHFENFDIKSNVLNDWHTLKSCVCSLSELKQLMNEALSLGNEARKTKSKEYKNLSEIHDKIITMLSV